MIYWNTRKIIGGSTNSWPALSQRWAQRQGAPLSACNPGRNARILAPPLSKGRVRNKNRIRRWVSCLHNFGGKHAGHDRRQSVGSTPPMIPTRCALRRLQPPDPRFPARGRYMTASRAIQQRVFESARKNKRRISHIPISGNVGNTATHPPKSPRNHTSGSDLGTLTFPRKNRDKPSPRPVSTRGGPPPKQGRKRFPHRVAIHVR
jgi:hypothetical protein